MKKYIFGLLASSMILSSCSKDRVSSDTFAPMDEFFNENKVEEQEFIIPHEDSTGHITGNQGTEIYVSKRLFKYADRMTEVTFPYSIKLVELYKYDDMIFYQLSSQQASGALDNGGKIRVRAFKEKEELVLIPGAFLTAKFSSTVTNTDMKPFQGTAVDDTFDQWNLETDGSGVSIVDNKYSYNTFTTGWLTPAKNIASTGKTDINFTVNGSGGEFISLAACFKDYHCVLTGNNLVIKDVPVGESVTIVAMAKDQDGKYRLHTESLIVNSGTTIELDMKEVDEATLLSTLDGL